MITLLLQALNLIQFTVRTTFLAVLVTEKLNFPVETMAVFHIINAVIMLLTLILIAPLLSHITRRWPIVMGVWFHIAAMALLLFSPPTRNYPLLIAGSVFIALGTSIATPRIEALVANTIINDDRSVANAVMAVIVLALSTPFGYIGGLLSDIDARLPFVLIMAILTLCLFLLRLTAALERKFRQPV